MLSFVKNFVFALFQSKSHVIQNDISEDIEESLRNINLEDCESEINVTNNIFTNKQIGQSKPAQLDVEILKFTHRTGKVTYINENYGLVDNFIYFNLNQVVDGLTLTEGNEVCYSSYKAKENESERIHKIYSLKNESWELKQDQSVNDLNVKKDENIPALSRQMNGRVIERKGRKLFIEPINVWCNLDEIDASYIPIQGDWVSLEATVSVDEKAVDLAGDIVEITSLKPLIIKSGVGRITLWSKIKQEGAIENHIYINKSLCPHEYVPNLGDEIFYEAIESDQGLYKWRALKINFTFKSSSKEFESHSELENLLKDKCNIIIQPKNCKLDIELNDISQAVIKIMNIGTTDQTLNSIIFHHHASQSQLSLSTPIPDNGINVQSKALIEVPIKCCGKFLGFNNELCTFNFEGFKIGKIFEVNVTSKEIKKLLNLSNTTSYFKKFNISLSKEDMNENYSLCGPKPWTPPKFSYGEKKIIYRVPEKLISIFSDDSNKNLNSVVRKLKELYPFWSEGLKSSNYIDKFHILLYIEEIELHRRFKLLDQQGVFLRRKGEYLVMNIPVQFQQLPFLVTGDKVVVTQPWAELKNIKQLGYIHNVTQNEIFIKFHESFHQLYDESECDVGFRPCLASFHRAHDAINRAMKRLGAPWLFPNSVKEKPAFIDVEYNDVEEERFENSCDDCNDYSDMLGFESEVDKNGFVSFQGNSLKNKMHWYNQKLNKRQKLAVINALKGHGRPLPYIIFGPPGTGKTITLVEIVMQIYNLKRDSRILVTTPSNSAADLITERLIEAGEFKPGQLVRVVAVRRAKENKVPQKLVPYCTLISIAEDINKSAIGIPNEQNIRTSSHSQLVGRHRITVGTCSCVGTLHYLGFNPGHFTHILVDEAGQATEPEILIPATFLNVSNGQVILVGDHKQLGPVCFSSVAKKNGLELSLMERLMSCSPYQLDSETFCKTSGYDPRFVTALNMNYRSLPEILSLPSQLFYNSGLVPMISSTFSTEADLLEKINFKIKGRDKAPAIIFHGILGSSLQEQDSASWFNPHEIWQTVTYIRKLYDSGLTSDDIGIITPYSKQVQKLHFLMNIFNISCPKIGTVEDFQGQERQVIIVSAVRSSLKHISNEVHHFLGFIANPRRINVILTRARTLLIVLGNPVVLSRDPYWKTVIEYCIQNNSYTGCNLLNYIKSGVQNNQESQLK